MAQTKDQILNQGYIDLHLRVGGILQVHRFIVTKEKTGFGEVMFLVTKGKVAAGELARVAEELQMPMRSPLGTAFPKNKGPKDFVIV